MTVTCSIEKSFCWEYYCIKENFIWTAYVFFDKRVTLDSWNKQRTKKEFLHNTLGTMNKRVTALVCKQGYVFVQNNSQVKIKFNLIWLSPNTKKIENPAKLS